MLSTTRIVERFDGALGAGGGIATRLTSCGCPNDWVCWPAITLSSALCLQCFSPDPDHSNANSPVRDWIAAFLKGPAAEGTGIRMVRQKLANEFHGVQVSGLPEGVFLQEGRAGAACRLTVASQGGVAG